MIKFMILFHQPDNPETFENVYQDFLALIERMPHIIRRQVVHVTGSPQGTPQYYRILEIYFDSLDKQQAALLSPIGQEAGKELGRLPQGAVDLLFADVYEEEGGSTPTPDEQTEADVSEESEPTEEETNELEPREVNSERDNDAPVSDKQLDEGEA